MHARIYSIKEINIVEQYGIVQQYGTNSFNNYEINLIILKLVSCYICESLCFFFFIIL